VGLDRAASRGALHAPRHAVPVTRVLEANTRRVRAIPQGRPAAFSRSPRPVTRSPAQAGRAGASRGVAGRGSPASAAVTRRGRPTQPASVDAGEQRGESPTRARGSIARSGVPACRNGCRSRRTTPRPREARLRWQGSARTGAQPRVASRKASRPGRKARREPVVTAATPWRRPRPEPGVRKGVAGQRSSLDGRHLGSFAGSSRSRGWVGDDLGGPRRGLRSASSRGPVEGGDRGVRGSVRTHPGGKKRPPVVTRKRRATRRSVMRTAVKQATTPSARASNRHDAPGTDETRVPVRRPSEMAEVGPTHPPRSARRRAERLDGVAGASRGAFRTHALTRGAAASR